MRASSSRSVRLSSSIPASEKRHPKPPPLSAKMWSLTKRAIGTMLQAAPALANHGVFFCCSVFARVIVAFLVEAEAPELKHLWVLPHDEPCGDCERWKREHCEQTKPNEENRYADEDNRHPCAEVEAQLGSWPIERLINR